MSTGEHTIGDACGVDPHRRDRSRFTHRQGRTSRWRSPRAPRSRVCWLRRSHTSDRFPANPSKLISRWRRCTASRTSGSSVLIFRDGAAGGRHVRIRRGQGALEAGDTTQLVDDESAGAQREVSDVPARYEAERWGLELRPIVAQDLGRFSVVVNPIVDVPLTGGAATFEPAAEVLFAWPRLVSLGFEYYADLGDITDWSRVRTTAWRYPLEHATLLQHRIEALHCWP